MRRIFPLLFAALPLWAAPAPFLAKKPATNEPDLQALQGEWEYANGWHEDDPLNPPGRDSWSVKGDKLTIHGARGKAVERAKLVLGRTKAPKEMEAIMETGEAAGLVFQFRYLVQGEILTVYGRMHDDRPIPPPGLRLGKGQILKVFKRKAP